MLAALGDVVDDIVVRIGGPIHLTSDTDASITRRRGGSAANVAATAAHLAGRARFLGQVGDDATADLLLAELVADDVDVSFVRRGGRTGAIVVFVDEFGERCFLTDAGSARALDAPDPSWLDGVDVLHVPFYSWSTSRSRRRRTTIGWAHDRGIAVSIDASSVAVLESFGVDRAWRLFAALRPSVFFANDDEARFLGVTSAVGDAVTFVRHGAGDAVVRLPEGATCVVPPLEIGDVSDTTGAGDAFAAGVLTSVAWRTDECDLRAGPRAAALCFHRPRK